MLLIERARIACTHASAGIRATWESVIKESNRGTCDFYPVVAQENQQLLS